MLSNIRVGKITSSSIHYLMKKGRGNLPSVQTTTYLEEKLMEKRLGRSLDVEMSSRPTSWGTLIESRLYSLLDQFEYTYCSSDTLQHPEIEYWVGTPDFLTLDKVCDGKCPFTLKEFVRLADICISGDVEKLKTVKPEYYWQLVSNSILTGKKTAELIAYAPYLSELQSIREMTENLDEEIQNKAAWIFFSQDNDLPWLPDDGYYKNINKLSFEVSEEDKQALTDAVVVAGQVLEAA